MHIVSNYSGWRHNDQGDFKKRVDESIEKSKAAKPTDVGNPQNPHL